MWRLRGRADKNSVSATGEDTRAQIERLTASTRVHPERTAERRLLHLRHQAGIGLLDAGESSPEYASPDFARLPESDGLPEIAAGELRPELLRAAILRDGCLLVRGLVGREAALGFADQIERAFAERERINEGASPAEGYYEEFQPDDRFGVDVPRPWVQLGGGLLAADSPMLAFEMFELFEAARLAELIGGYLGEPPLISVQKTTLRKADPAVSGAWHQDGAFMGVSRSVNLWLSLSHCGDEAPGLDIVPRRLEQLVTIGDGADLDFEFQISQARAEEVAGDKPIVRPIFEPGDALLFDHLFLHQTGSDPSMPKPRFAIENWFFGASAFPADYAPIAV